MRTFLIVAGGVWFTLAVLMVFAVAFAARWRMPDAPPRTRRTAKLVESPLILESDTKVASQQMVEMETLVGK
jgi:hypothetical protein